MDLNAPILADRGPWVTEFILHVTPHLDWICSQLFQFLLRLILELPQPVAPLNDCSFIHQEFELPKVTVGFEISPCLLDGHSGHGWTTITFIHLLWISDDAENLPLIGYASNQILFGISILIQIGILQHLRSTNVRKFHDVLSQELFKLVYKLGDGTPLSDVFSFELLEFGTVLSENTFVNQELSFTICVFLRRLGFVPRRLAVACCPIIIIFDLILIFLVVHVWLFCIFIINHHLVLLSALRAWTVKLVRLLGRPRWRRRLRLKSISLAIGSWCLRHSRLLKSFHGWTRLNIVGLCCCSLLLNRLFLGRSSQNIIILNVHGSKKCVISLKVDFRYGLWVR